MKRTGYIIISIILCAVHAVVSQQANMQFFEENGYINHAEELSNDLGYTLTHLNNRADDVVWAHVVYSIVDMRDNQNLQLAFPNDQDVNYKNLFKLLAESVVAGTPVFYPNESSLSPYFDSINRVPVQKLADVFFIETNVAGAQYIDPLFELDSATNTLNISNRIYNRFSNSIKKFLIQKVYYFDKHLSQFNSKIIGIAPLMDADQVASPFFASSFEDNDIEQDNQALKTTLRESVVCWFLYDHLQPFLSVQPVYQTSNAAQRISYHEYFRKKMYADYLIGDQNLMKRLYSNTEILSADQINQEIDRIQRKLVAVESEIWGN